MLKIISFLSSELFERNKTKIPPEWNLIFAQDHGEKGIIEACKDADFMIVPASNPPITAQIIQNIPSVSLLQVFGAGFDKIDIAAARELELPVANTPGQNATTVAEFVVGAIVALQRKIIVGNREVKAGRHWEIEQEFIRTGLPEIRGTGIGLVGLGTIGRQVARLLAFMGARVSYYDPFRPHKSVENELGVHYSTFKELLQNNEIISLHVLLNEETRWLISRDELALMPQGALLINTARGDVLDQTALAEALESGHLGGAVVDNFSPDPPPPDHPLLNLTKAANEKFIASPHIAGVTTASFSRMLEEALANIKHVAMGENPRYVVNGIVSARK
jgi:phosphoglycerate dehydrogenase-like enzyme